MDQQHSTGNKWRHLVALMAHCCYLSIIDWRPAAFVSLQHASEVLAKWYSAWRSNRPIGLGAFLLANWCQSQIWLWLIISLPDEGVGFQQAYLEPWNSLTQTGRLISPHICIVGNQGAVKLFIWWLQAANSQLVSYSHIVILRGVTSAGKRYVPEG